MPGRKNRTDKTRPPKGKNDEFFADLVRQGVLGVGTDGSIWRLKSQRGPLPRRVDYLHDDGYRCVSVGRRGIYAHRLVWLVERGPIPPGMEINHRDNDRAHNQIENLEMLTGSANQAHAYQNPDRWRPRGEQNGYAKLTEASVREARRLWSEGLTQTEIARRFGVSREAIKAVVHGTTWRHV